MAVATVLLVEPNDHLRTVFRRLFARAGFELLEVADGETALGVAHDGVPDLIVVEGSVRDASGLGLPGRFADDPALQQVPVIVLAARPRDGDDRDDGSGPWPLGAEHVDAEVVVAVGRPHLQHLQHPFRPRRLIELARGTLDSTHEGATPLP